MKCRLKPKVQPVFLVTYVLEMLAIGYNNVVVLHFFMCPVLLYILKVLCRCLL